MTKANSNDYCVDDLTPADMPDIGWSGNPGHLRNVRQQLERVASGDVAYLAIRAGDGKPVAKGMIDYTSHPNAGTIEQLAVVPELQGQGLGSRLIAAAEDRIRTRGLHWAILGVDEENVRARRLYERLGYIEFGHEEASWEVQDEAGIVSMHYAHLAMLRRQLTTTP